MAELEFVRTEREGRVLVVTLNRPEVMNACHAPMHHELHGVWNDFADDPELWVAVLTGAGDRAFSAGNDLKATHSGAGIDWPPTGFCGLTSRFDLEKPIVAAVNGVAMGGGFETALACDLIVASDKARFALPEVRVGLFAAAGGVQRLSRQIGRKAAAGMMLSGRTVHAEEAAALGIVNEVVPHEGLKARALEVARDLAAVSPSSIKATKRVLNAMDVSDRLPESLAYSREVSTELRATEDAKEGVAAFVEKRAPEWRNR